MPATPAANRLKVWRRRLRDSGTHWLYRSPSWVQRFNGFLQRELLGRPVPRLSTRARPYLEKHPDEGRWHAVFPEIAAGYPDPITLPEDRATFASFRAPVFRDTGIAELHHAEVIGQHAIPYTRRGVLLHDLTFFEKQPPAEAYAARAPHTWHHLPGRTLSLGTPYACINFTHSLVDCLPRLHLARAAGLDPASFDQIILPRIPFPLLRAALLSALTVPESQIRWADTGVGFRCDTLFQTAHPCVDLAPAYPPWIRSALPPSLLTPPASTAVRRIYLARGPGRRALINETEVAALCSEFGFETVASSSLKDAAAYVRLFSESSAVISPHGAGLTNVIFMPPGGTVVELSPSDWIRPYYYTLAAGNAQRFAALRTGSDGVMLPEQDYTTSVIADLGKLRRLLTELFPAQP
jgi:hypothetical protein